MTDKERIDQLTSKLQKVESELKSGIAQETQTILIDRSIAQLGGEA